MTAPERKLRLVSVSKGDADAAPHVIRGARPSLDDSELLRDLREGSEDAAYALHDRARPLVNRVIARLLGRADRDRDDLAQKALIEIVYTIGRFRGDCSLDTWIGTLTARVIFKEIRRRTTERRLFESFGETSEHPGPLDMGHDMQRRSLLAKVRAHLDFIDEAKAWTFMLHDVCGYDLREVAEITGVSVAAAQTRLVRGRKELYERCAGDADLAALLRREV